MDVGWFDDLNEKTSDAVVIECSCVVEMGDAGAVADKMSSVSARAVIVGSGPSACEGAPTPRGERLSPAAACGSLGTAKDLNTHALSSLYPSRLPPFFFFRQHICNPLGSTPCPGHEDFFASRRAASELSPINFVSPGYAGSIAPQSKRT